MVPQLGAPQIAELTGLEIGFEDDGTVVISWNGDEDWGTGFVTAGINSAPANPTSGTNDGDLVGQSGALILDGTGSTTLRQAAMGDMVFVKVLPETGAPVAGTFRRRRGDTEFVPPRFEIEFDRDAQGNATLRLNVYDPTGAIQSPGPQFSKRPGSQAGDVWSSFSAVWGTEPTNPPYAGLWVEALTVPGGEEAGIRWQYSWVDEDGTTRTHGHTHYTAALDEHASVLIISAAECVPEFDTTVFRFAAFGYIRPNNLNLQNFVLPITLPEGVRVTEVMVRVHAFGTSDSVVCTFNRISNTGGRVVVATLTAVGGSAWQDVVSGALTETVTSPSTYQLGIAMNANVAAVNTRFLYCRVTYDRFTNRQKV